MRVFLAGATGAVGRRLVPQLVDAGHRVVATTRTNEKLAQLYDLGAEGVLLDALDAAAVTKAVEQAEPDAIMHQMTGLAGQSDLKHFDRTFAQTNRLRTAGTDNLLAAAQATGVKRLIVQSFTGWTTGPGPGFAVNEDEPFDPRPPKQQRESLAAIAHLERAVLHAPLDGIVLRYGLFYGPGATDDWVRLLRKRRMPVVGEGTAIWSMLHLDDAASAAVAALTAPPGVYNVVDDDPAPVRQVVDELAAAVGAERPMRVPVWLARLAAGEVGVSMMTRIRGASNANARRELGWTPRWPSWRAGFRAGLGVADDHDR
jgi:nucleoside-diphosphate-sugar epimerase